MCEDMFNEIMNASGKADTEQSVWRIALSEKLDMASRTAAQESECGTQQEMLRTLKEQTGRLRHLVDFQEKHLEARLPLQPLQNDIPT